MATAKKAKTRRMAAPTFRKVLAKLDERTRAAVIEEVSEAAALAFEAAFDAWLDRSRERLEVQS